MSLFLDECSEIDVNILRVRALKKLYLNVILRKSGQSVHRSFRQIRVPLFLATSGIISMIHEQLFQELGKFG